MFQTRFIDFIYRVHRGGCPMGGGNWGTLRIPFGKIGEPSGTLGKGNHQPPLRVLLKMWH